MADDKKIGDGKLNDHVKDVCKIGQGNACCRYLVMGGGGFECAKHSSLRNVLDERVKSKTINAQGDNCPGYEFFSKN